MLVTVRCFIQRGGYGQMSRDSSLHPPTRANGHRRKWRRPRHGSDRRRPPLRGPIGPFTPPIESHTQIVITPDGNTISVAGIRTSSPSMEINATVDGQTFSVYRGAENALCLTGLFNFMPFEVGAANDSCQQTEDPNTRYGRHGRGRRQRNSRVMSWRKPPTMVELLRWYSLVQLRTLRSDGK